MWATLTVVERAALAHRWAWWARPKQLAPVGDVWRSWGLCTGRGFGKTKALAEHVHSFAMAHPGCRVCLIAQNEDKTFEVMVDGEAGLIAIAPWWERPRWERGRLLWPNGSQAFAFTPERPDAIRGPGFHLSWCSEFVGWPRNTRDDAWSNVRMMTRLRPARIIWDTTPRRHHPIVRELLARSALQAEQHVVIRGTTRENVLNLDPNALAEWEAEYAGTVKGREELEGEFIDELVGVLWHPDWIAQNRRQEPARLERRVIAVDPAKSAKRHSDETGLVECGLGTDGQVYVLSDRTKRWAWEAWGYEVLALYRHNRLDCVVVENNIGAEIISGNLRACAANMQPPMTIVQVKADATTRHEPGTVYVKEATARSSKESRAEPVASLYQKGRVSHVEGADLEELERQQTTWEPGTGPSPNRIDALVWAVWELAGLGREGKRKAVGGAAGLATLAARIAAAPSGDRTPVGKLLPSLQGRPVRI